MQIWLIDSTEQCACHAMPARIAFLQNNVLGSKAQSNYAFAKYNSIWAIEC